MPDNEVIINLEEVSNSCFVAMPFDPVFDTEYERVIKPAIKSVGLLPIRGDEIYAHQAIVHGVWKSLRQARVVVAELSGRNPNVMYEIGLAHAIGKPVVLLTRNQSDVPFDLKALRYLYYDRNNPSWGDDLRVRLSEMLERTLVASQIGEHLPMITVNTEALQPPNRPAQQAAATEAAIDIGGVWMGSWRSIRTERLHNATLVVASGHGADFTASMTIDYERQGERVIVQESFVGRIVGRAVNLTGVSYTYVQQATSAGYSLDAFELTLEGEQQALVGYAKLRGGTPPVTFQRNQPTTNGAAPVSSTAV